MQISGTNLLIAGQQARSQPRAVQTTAKPETPQVSEAPEFETLTFKTKTIEPPVTNVTAARAAAGNFAPAKPMGSQLDIKV